MTTDLTSTTQADLLALAGQVANGYAAAATFADYRSRKAANTLDAQRSDLDTWAAFLCTATNGADCPTSDDLATKPEAWQGVTWGLVSAFVQWMLKEGYAMSTVGRKLATVKKYCRLAVQAGAITVETGAMIRTVAGYHGKEAKRVDTQREKTRQSTKKAEHTRIEPEQAAAMKAQPDTPQGRRDAVIMVLLLDHGLRVGELAGLAVTAFDLKAGTFTFYREKVGKFQTHRMTPDTKRAVATWLKNDALAMGSLLRASLKSGALGKSGMSARAVTERVTVLGAAIGLMGLSAHDCRHYWATRAASKGTDPFALRDAGGWSSLAMPSRYVEAATIANERVIL
jgi:integrase